MTTKREAILSALHVLLQTVEGYTVLRNAPLGDVAGTFVCLHDGEIEQTEEFINAPVFEFTATAALLIAVQHEDPAERDSLLDAAIAAFTAVAEGAPAPLADNVTAVRVRPAELAPREVWGALAMKAAELPIEIDYWTGTSAG